MPQKTWMKYITFVTVFAKLQSHLIQYQAIQPHDNNCYTQGLFFLNQTHVFETCGLYNKSYFRILQYQREPFSLTEVYKTDVPWKNNIFLQGAILFKGHLYLLTWRQHTVYKLNPQNYEVVKEIPWNKQGWGLTHNQTHMFTTDGSNNIYLVDQDFKLIGKKQIISQTGRRVNNINQLQYVNGHIYANIYLNSKIVKIQYEKGKVVEQYDAIKIIRAETASGYLLQDQVINGIAYDAKQGKFLLTGKHWRNFYRVSI